MKTGVVIPVKDEPRFARVVENFARAGGPAALGVSEVVAVDDGSTDQSTFDPAARAGFTVLRHDASRGVGAAIRTGLLHLRGSGHEVAVVMAGNGKDDPSEIPSLLAAIEGGADYVQGSRYLEGGRFDNLPALRRILTRLVPWAWSLWFLRSLTEITNGFRAYRLSLLDRPEIRIEQEWLDTYELEYYLQYRVLEMRCDYREVPVSKIYPTDGMPVSKIRLSKDLWRLLRPFVYLALRVKS